jgi:hypothetical protein
METGATAAYGGREELTEGIGRDVGWGCSIFQWKGGYRSWHILHLRSVQSKFYFKKKPSGNSRKL